MADKVDMLGTFDIGKSISNKSPCRRQGPFV